MPKVFFKLEKHLSKPDEEVVEIWAEDPNETKMIAAIYQRESGHGLGKIRIISKHGISIRFLEKYTDMEIQIG